MQNKRHGSCPPGAGIWRREVRRNWVLKSFHQSEEVYMGVWSEEEVREQKKMQASAT